MVRRIGGGAALLLVLVLAGTASLASPDTAVAQVAPPEPVEKLAARTASDPMVKQFWKDVMRNAVVTDGAKKATHVDPLTPATKRHIFARIMQSRRGARLLPLSPGALLRLGLVGAGAYVGWRVYQHFFGGDATLDMWLDSSTLGADSLFNPAAVPFGTAKSNLGWARTGASRACDSETQLFNDANQCESGAAWTYNALADATNGGCGPVAPPCFALHVNPVSIVAASYNGTVSQSHASACTGAPWNGSSCIYDWDDANVSNMLTVIWPDASQLGMCSCWQNQLAYMQTRTFKQVATRWPGSIYDVGTWTNGSDTTDQLRVLVPADEFMDSLGVSPAEAGTPTLQEHYTVPPPYTADPEVGGTETDLDEALTPIMDDPCTRAWVNWVLDPGGYSFDPDCLANPPVDPEDPATGTFTLPQPAADETYSSYASRLRSLGFLGAISRRTWTEEEAVPELAPDAITRVKLGSPTSGATYFDYPFVGWTATIPVEQPITVWQNPGPEAGDGTTGTGDDGGTITPVPPNEGDPFGDCDCPPVNWDPLTEADLGGSFPFGVVVWVGGVLSSLTTTADAPHFDFDYTSTAAGSMGTYNLGHYDVDLDVMDPYMSIIRTILSWCIWIGGVWWFGSRLLGFRETGDPGSAVDDAW